jgi:hypothetical protein
VRAVRRLLDPVLAALEADDAPGALALVVQRAREGGPPCALYAETAARAVRSDHVRHGWLEVHDALRDALADVTGPHSDAAAVLTAVVGTLTAASAGMAPAAGVLDRS